MSSKPEAQTTPLRSVTARVDCGDGAVMFLADPAAEPDGGAEWQMRYGDPESVRFGVAAILSSYDYLLSDEISMMEATRRLRLLRWKRKELANGR